MKLLFAALAFVAVGAWACPADKEVQAAAPDKAAVAKAPERAATKQTASKKTQAPTKVAAETTRKSSL
jgi:hypothetical protein